MCLWEQKPVKEGPARAARATPRPEEKEWRRKADGTKETQ